MAVSIGRRVEPFECKSIPSEQLTKGHRIVEDNRLSAVVIERIRVESGACKTNIHVRVTTGGTQSNGEPNDRIWCYSAGTTTNVVADY